MCGNFLSDVPRQEMEDHRQRGSCLYYVDYYVFHFSIFILTNVRLCFWIFWVNLKSISNPLLNTLQFLGIAISNFMITTIKTNFKTFILTLSFLVYFFLVVWGKNVSGRSVNSCYQLYGSCAQQIINQQK